MSEHSYLSMKKYLICLVSIIVILLMTLALIGLGFWQLHRYHYKKQLLLRYVQAKEHPVMTLSGLLHARHQQFMPLRVSGEVITKKAIWVENDLRDGNGYHLIVPLRVDGHQPWLLVNFGWLPAHAGHQQPKMPALSAHALKGHVRFPQKLPWLIGNNVRNPGQFPLEIQSLDMKEVQKVLDHALFPFVLYLDPEKASAFKRDFVVTTVAPKRHLIYAIQWFLFAIIFLLGSVLLIKKRRHKYEA